jgi:hypothetical protein
MSNQQSFCQKFLNAQTYVSRNPPQQYRRDILSFMERERRLPAVGVTILPV